MCSSCGNSKPESEFHWRDKEFGKRRGYCRVWQTIKHRKWYEENSDQVRTNVKETRRGSKRTAREDIQNYLSTHSCVDCGETNPVVLDFDHVRGRRKLSISRSVGDGHSIQAIQEEESRWGVSNILDALSASFMLTTPLPRKFVRTATSTSSATGLLRES